MMDQLGKCLLGLGTKSDSTHPRSFPGYLHLQVAKVELHTLARETDLNNR